MLLKARHVVFGFFSALLILERYGVTVIHTFWPARRRTPLPALTRD